MSDPTTTPVVLNSPWYSKINWVQIGGFAAMGATALGYTVPADLIPAATTVITGVVTVVTIVLRTWFTGKPATG